MHMPGYPVGIVITSGLLAREGSAFLMERKKADASLRSS
jgi:hypothetical protein